MARSRFSSIARLGGSGEAGGRRVTALLKPAAFRHSPAVNDNKAPLRIRLRRLVVLAALALGLLWLFWAGFLLR